MSAQDAAIRIIEQTRSLLRSERFLVVSTTPLNPDRVETLLTRFPQVGFIVTSDNAASNVQDHSRLGRRLEPGTAHWQMPAGTFHDAVIVGRRSQVGIRDVKAALFSGVRRFIFADPIKQAVSSESIFVLGLRLVARRALDRSWWRRPKVRTESLQELFRFADRANLAVRERHTQNVLLVVATMGPGGSERQVVNTALALAAEGRFRPVVVCTNLRSGTSEFYRPLLASAGVDVIDLQEFDFGRLPSKHAQFVSACRARLIRSAFDISDDVTSLLAVFVNEQPAIVHSFIDETNIKAGVAAVLARIPRTVLAMRSVAPNNFALDADLMRAGYEALLTRPEILVCCNSKAGAADYRQWLGKPDLPIAILENGIDLRQFSRPAGSNADGRAAFGIPSDAVVLGSIMRLTAEKQPILWANVVVEISRQMPDVHFVLVGDGPLKSDVMQILSRARIDHRVHLLGQVKDIPSVLSCLDLLVLTSRIEGLPNVLIEAQAMGVPVVTTPAGGAIEALAPGRTGLVAPDQTVTGVAQTCLRVLSDAQLRSQFAQAAPQYVRDRFSMDRMLHHTLQLYTNGRNVCLSHAALVAASTS